MIFFLVMKRSTALHVDRYHITVAVFMQELVKLLSSVSILTILAGSVLEPLWKLWRLRRRMIVLIVPCICYTGQNNLLYVGVQFLPAAVAQPITAISKRRTDSGRVGPKRAKSFPPVNCMLLGAE